MPALSAEDGQVKISEYFESLKGKEWILFVGFTLSAVVKGAFWFAPPLIAFHDMQTALQTWLPLTLAHELDHAQRVLDGPGYGRTLLQNMVSEGLADSFAGQVFPGAPAIPWDHSLSLAAEHVVWAFARPRLGHVQNSGRHAMWFYGTGRVPRWAGYTIGYDIVTSYLRAHPGATPASITDLPARRILRESSFRP